ncbi:MAG: endolytic transglycosylase MltG [bacterium]|nr:endolytic transglycosylase MltG [bacterium]
MTDPFAPSRRRHRLRWLLLFFALLVAGSAGFAWLRFIQPASRDAGFYDLTIQPGQGSSAIAAQLQQAGLIRDPWMFAAYAYLTGQDDRLQAGEYRLPKNLTLRQVLSRLTAPAAREERTLTIVEGWSNQELGEYLESKQVAPRQEFLAIVSRKAAWWDEYDFLDGRPPDRDLEGYLFPDTYRAYADATTETIVRKMLDNFGRKLTPDLRAEISRRGKTLHEVLTFASIIEREVPDGPDRRKVAGIFARRLEIGMALQSDATVNYVTGKKRASPTLDDVRTESLYNTYIHRGLPPGPINNPGLSAIRTALDPESSSYLYYLTTPDGTVIYSRTHDEHVAAKAKYLR